MIGGFLTRLRRLGRGSLWNPACSSVGSWGQCDAPTDGQAVSAVGLVNVRAKWFMSYANFQADEFPSFLTQHDNIAWDDYLKNNHYDGVYPGEHYCRITATLYSEFTERYTIGALTDDSVSVYIEEELIASWNGDAVNVWHEGEIDMIAGQPYRLYIVHGDTRVHEALFLRWRSDSQPTQIIPGTSIMSSDTGFWTQCSNPAGGWEACNGNG